MKPFSIVPKVSISCAYDRAIRSYYRSPVIIEIHSRLDQLMENS